jgi:hypothetical protein
MIFKAGVIANDVCPQVWYAVGVADSWRWQKGYGQATVAALRNGAHKVGSLHYQGRAVDIRTHDLTAGEREQFYDALRGKLFPIGFDVCLETDPPENEHLHIEYDPKPGRIWPLAEPASAAAKA